MLRRLMRAFAWSSEASGKAGRALVIRAAKSQSSIRVICISSNIVSTRIIFSIKFDRYNRGLLTEALRRERRLHRLRPEQREGVLGTALAAPSRCRCSMADRRTGCLAGVMEESIADERELSEMRGARSCVAGEFPPDRGASATRHAPAINTTQQTVARGRRGECRANWRAISPRGASLIDGVAEDRPFKRPPRSSKKTRFLRRTPALRGEVLRTARRVSPVCGFACRPARYLAALRAGDTPSAMRPSAAKASRRVRSLSRPRCGGLKLERTRS
jgi:hypothetical protein